jgi:hypothetical protein
MPVIKFGSKTRYYGYFASFITGNVSFEHLGNYILKMQKLLFFNHSSDSFGFITTAALIFVAAISVAGFINIFKKNRKGTFMVAGLLLLYLYFLLIISAPSQLEQRNLYLVFWPVAIFFSCGMESVLLAASTRHEELLRITIAVLILIKLSVDGTGKLLNEPVYTYNEVYKAGEWMENSVKKHPEYKIALFSPYIFRTMFDIPAGNFASFENKIETPDELLEEIKKQEITHIMYFHVFSNNEWIVSLLNSYYYRSQFMIEGMAFYKEEEFVDERNPGVHFVKVFRIDRNPDLKEYRKKNAEALYEEIYELGRWFESEIKKHPEYKIIFYEPGILTNSFDIPYKNVGAIEFNSLMSVNDLLEAIDMKKITHIAYVHTNSANVVPSFFNKYYGFNEFTAGSFNFYKVKHFVDEDNQPDAHFARVFRIIKKEL